MSEIQKRKIARIKVNFLFIYINVFSYQSGCFRYVDKLNKAERLRKKKEEMSRIRQLVDLAYNHDPRIAKFKQEDKEKKMAAKRAKQSVAQAKKEEEERILREAHLAKEQAEAAEKARIEAKRQEREVQKKALRKERKVFRDVCKAHNYYADSTQENLDHMTAVEDMCERLSLNELEELNKNIKNNGRSSFMKAMKENEIRKEKERIEELKSAKQKNIRDFKNDPGSVMNSPEWNEDNIQLLVKAVNLFPAGTNQRWEVVANFINQHGKFGANCSKFNSKIVLAKAKDLQSTDFTKNNLKETANRQAFEAFKKDKRIAFNIDESGISRNSEAVSIASDSTNEKNQKKSLSNGEMKKTDVPWTTVEQQLLEQALKTYPSTTPERWDRISECIPNRTKKDCVKRYKELVETVKAKKAAQAAVFAPK